MKQRWVYKDARGVQQEGFFEQFFDHGGTDVTYMFRRDDGGIDLVRGSRLEQARNITREHLNRNGGRHIAEVGEVI